MKRTESKTSWQRTLSTGFLLFFFAFPPMFDNNCGAHQERVHGTAQKINVRISSAKAKVQPGEGLRLRVEICNEGSESVYVATTFDGPDNALARLKISLFHNGSPVDGPKETSAGDYGRYAADDHRRPPLAELFSKYWVALAPGHFYGGEFVVGPSSFPQLNAPGKYMVRGTYASGGFLSEGMNNPLASDVEEVGRMRYQAWVGEVETNPIWIEVVKQRSAGESGAQH